MNRVVHFEIHADNTARAVEFYRNLFGWEISKWDGPVEYWLIKTGPDGQRGINGGMVKRHGVIDGTAVIAYLVKMVIGLRASEEVETVGLDLAEHGEEGYNAAS